MTLRCVSFKNNSIEQIHVALEGKLRQNRMSNAIIYRNVVVFYTYHKGITLTIQENTTKSITKLQCKA